MINFQVSSAELRKWIAVETAQQVQRMTLGVEDFAAYQNCVGKCHQLQALEMFLEKLQATRGADDDDNSDRNAGRKRAGIAADDW